MSNQVEVKQVFDVETRKGRKFWKKCGTATRNTDGSWSVELTRTPVGLSLLIDNPVFDGKTVGG